MRLLPSGYVSGLALTLGVAIFAVQPPARADEIPAVELVRRTVQNETKDRNPMKFMFRDDKKTPHGIQSRLIIETNQALVGMTIANDGKPLSPEERDAEISRLNAS